MGSHLSEHAREPHSDWADPPTRKLIDPGPGIVCNPTTKNLARCAPVGIVNPHSRLRVARMGGRNHRREVLAVWGPVEETSPHTVKGFRLVAPRIVNLGQAVGSAKDQAPVRTHVAPDRFCRLGGSCNGVVSESVSFLKIRDDSIPGCRAVKINDCPLRFHRGKTFK